MTSREDMKAAAKFVATCANCGQKSRALTAYGAERWMNIHEREHRLLAATPPTTRTDEESQR